MAKAVVGIYCAKEKTFWFFLLATCFFAINVHAQQNNHWYFGSGAAVSFNPGNLPIPYSLANSAMNSNEGSATISDENGNLLFYTNGEEIYSKNHQPMLNGNGLMGHESMFQGAVILRQPKHDSLYFVFYGDAFEHGFANGYRYSIVNMNRNNGLGEVISKNVLLQSNNSERLTAAKHANSIDLWIITNDANSNIFKAWLLTCNGLQTSPVISQSGDVLNQFGMMSIGSIKISPDGKKLCQTHFPEHGDVTGVSNFAQLFDFNNITGQISNPQKISIPSSNLHASEFSPNSKLLYFTDPFKDSVLQVEATLASSAAINASVKSIPADYGFYGIQLAPDGKIYLNQSDEYLSVISSPDEKGIACQFQVDKINLDKKGGRLGLPFVLNDLSPSLNNFVYTVVDSCKGGVQFYGSTGLPGNVQWQWDFGDGSTSTSQNPFHIFNTPAQTYQVKLKITSPSSCGYILISKYVIPKGILAKAYFDFVIKCDSNYVRFDNLSSYSDTANFYWNFGDGITSTLQNPTHTYAAPGNYTTKLRIKGTGSCAVDSVSKVVSVVLFNVQASAGQTINEGQTVQLSVSGGGNFFQWSPTTFLSNANIANPKASPTADIVYEVIVKNEFDCLAIDSVAIKVNQVQDIYVPDAFTPNNDGVNETFKPLMGVRFFLSEFSVFNRWGQKVFSTSQKGNGWNGKLNGKDLPQGVYVWTLKARDRQNKLIERKGTFLLVR